MESIRVDIAGRVGIGTTSPTARLMANTRANTSPLVVQIGEATKLFMHAIGGLQLGAVPHFLLPASMSTEMSALAPTHLARTYMWG